VETKPKKLSKAEQARVLLAVLLVMVMVMVMVMALVVALDKRDKLQSGWYMLFMLMLFSLGLVKLFLAFFFKYKTTDCRCFVTRECLIHIF